MGDYLVRFSAVSADPLEEDAARRLATALATTPGLASADGAEQDDSRRRVSGAFSIDVKRGMAAAARDGSRLAKEALNAAGLADAQLVELTITLREAV